MSKFKNPKQRERHMRIFRKKISTCDKSYLEKLLNKVWDYWTWDTGSNMDEEKIRLIKEELKCRATFEKEFNIRFSMGSQRKQRQKYRNWENKINQAYEKSMKKYGSKSNS